MDQNEEIELLKGLFKKLSRNKAYASQFVENLTMDFQFFSFAHDKNGEKQLNQALSDYYEMKKGLLIMFNKLLGTLEDNSFDSAELNRVNKKIFEEIADFPFDRPVSSNLYLKMKKDAKGKAVVDNSGDQKTYTKEVAATMIGITRPTLLKLIKENKFLVTRMPPKGKEVITLGNIKDFIIAFPYEVKPDRIPEKYSEILKDALKALD